MFEKIFESLKSCQSDSSIIMSQLSYESVGVAQHWLYVLVEEIEGISIASWWKSALQPNATRDYTYYSCAYINELKRDLEAAEIVHKIIKT